MNKLTALFIVTLTALLGTSAPAAIRTWTGAGTNNNWNNATNWSGTAPVANDQLFFGGTTGLTNTNNIAANTAFNSITFNSTAGAFTLRGNALNLAGGVTNNCLTNAETISLNLALTATRTFDVVNSGTLSIGGVISGSSFGVTKVNAGTLRLSGTNTYTGTTTINGGTVSITADNNLGGSGGLAFANGGTLLNIGAGAQSSSRAITLNSGGGLISLNGPTVTLTGAITSGGGLATGGGDLILQPTSGNNNIGTMTVNSGRLFVFNTGAINGSAVVVNNGATLDFGGSASASPTNTMTFASGACLANRLGSTLTVNTTNSAFPKAGTMIFNQDDQPTTNIIVNGSYPALTGDLTIQVGGSAGAPGNLTLSGAISGNYGLLKTLNGTLILSGASSYAGNTTISAGRLRLGAANVIPDGSGKGNVTVNGTLDLGGFSDTINGLSGSGTVDNTVGTSIYTLTVGNNDQTSAFSGTITDTAGTLSLTKIGAGRLTLSGSNTCSGVVTVLAGTLEIQKDAGLGSVTNVNIGTGATLRLDLGTSNNYINDAATVSLTNTAVMNLSFTGSDTVSNLYVNGAHKLAGTWGATGSGATHIDDNHFQGTGVLNVTAGPTSATTVSGSPNPSIWGSSVTFTATITGTNGVPPLSGMVTFKDGATVLGTGPLSGSPTAAATFSTNGLSIGSHTITAIYSGDTNFAGSTSGNFTQSVTPGPFAKLQLLLPGETAAPGTPSGKTGTPNAETAGTSCTVTVNAVDANWNLINTNDTVKITSSDTSATLPANAALVTGTNNFTITLQSSGATTITASNVTHTGITPCTSPPVTVYYLTPALQGKPVVAIHDSELTRALETMPASGATPTGPGTTTNQWWPTNWHYFVMPESVKEALRSDGTAFELTGDTDIRAGRLLTASGQPQCPIVISLAAEAVSDDEIPALTNYVAAGGTLLVGSSAFTRNPDGTPRGDFALAGPMGLHSINTNLLNWTTDTTFTKGLNHSLVSHIPDGTLTWQMPTAADEIPWGISPVHTVPTGQAFWQVRVSDASVLAWGDSALPYLTIKQYGRGTIIYIAAMQPLIGHSGWAPGMYAYGIFRNAIQLAFAAAGMPLPKLSPWPYAYDAAFNVRHDFEDYQNVITNIESSARAEFTNGVRGDYYFCTGTLRVELTNSAAVIASLRRAVSNYGATIGPHNGGLTNPNNPSLVLSNYDYWHWGPDEALDVTPPGYASGKAYASASISNSFLDVEGWLAGLTNGIRSWVSPYFNSVREDSYDLLEQLQVKTAGEQKLSPFPHWTLSTRTSGKRYSALTVPVTDWFVGSQIAQSMEAGHTTNSIHDAVDFYYGLGALVNIYSHSSSDGGGAVGNLVQEYIRYSITKPRLWITNAFGLRNWWLTRSNAQVTPAFFTNNSQFVTTLAIKGATDTNTAVELLIPATNYYGLQVFTNGVLASASRYRTNGQVAKLLVGTSVTNAEFRYSVPPVAVGDVYYAVQNATLSVPMPGVLDNDSAGSSSSITAVLVSGPANGTLVLNPNGAFTYTPNTNFTGADSFSYVVTDGTVNSSPVTVTLSVTSNGQLFADDFTRSTSTNNLAPWQASLGSWTVTNGMMQGTSSLLGYGFAYADNSFTNYWVQARFQFPTGAYGGGLGGRLNPLTGAHYGAWIYPETTNGGYATLNLIKFQSWTSWGYNGLGFTPMLSVAVPSLGTNWHTVRIAFHANQIAVYFDGSQVISTADLESQPYTSGGISLDLFTGSAPYTVSVDDVVASSLVVGDSYNAWENAALTVPGAGVLGNDTEVYGTSLSAAVVSNPAHGTLNLNPDGGFTYSPATNFAGADSFVYQANDGATNLGTGTVLITVNPALVVTADNQTRPYGAANPALTGTIVGLLNGDNITPVFSTTADTNSPASTYTITAGLLDPDQKLGNYTVTTNNGTLTVTQALLTVTADAKTKVYGAPAPAFTASYTGFVNADTTGVLSGSPSLTTLATQASPIGNYTITAGPGSLSASNYTFTFVDGTLAIGPGQVTVTGITADNKPYDGTTSATLHTGGAAMDGALSGDDLTLNTAGATGAFADAAIGTGKTVHVSGLTLAGSSATNYALLQPTTTADITLRGLTVVGVAASNKVYDGTTNATLIVTNAVLAGVVSGEDVTLDTTNAVGAFADAAVGTNKTVTASGLALLGANAGNYALTQPTTNSDITPRPITVTADARTKYYGQSDPAFTCQITSGSLVGGDSLSGSLIRVPGEGLGVYPILQGTLAAGSNYDLTYVSAELIITQLTLLATGITADNKPYDGTTNATLILTNTALVGLAGGDDVTLDTTNAVGAFADPTVGAGKMVTVSGLALLGTDASKYSLTQPTTNADITPATLTPSVTVSSKVYDATTAAVITSRSLSGIIGSDDVSLGSSGSAAFSDKNVGADKTVNVTLLSLSGSAATNYVLSADSTATTAGIAPLPITVIADPKTKAFGDSDPVFTYEVSNGSFIGGNSLPGGDSFSGNLARVPGENVGVYAILQNNLSAGANYSITFVSADLSITTGQSSLAVISTLNPAALGATVTITADLAPTAPNGLGPTGSVQFYLNDSAYGGPVPISVGGASFSAADLPVGTNVILATYAGDSNCIGSTNSLVQIVDPSALRPAALGITVSKSGTVTVTFSGAPGSNYVVQACAGVAASGWQNVSTNVADAQGHWIFSENPGGLQQRFYRAATP